MNKKDYQITIPSFFWQIIKPYKGWFLLMLQAPIIGAFFTPVNNYVLKLIVDQITQNQEFSLQHVIFPVYIYCAASIILEVVWRISNYADYKSQPFIEAEIVNKSYTMLLSHNYQFFQNNLSGKLASKINTLRDKYVSILDNLMFGSIWRTVSIILTVGLFFLVNFKLAIGVLLWLLIFMPLMFWLKKKGMIYSEKSTKEKQKITGLVNDGISNIANVLFFHARPHERNLIKKANQNFIQKEKQRLMFLFINHLVIGFIYAGLSIAILFALIDLKTKNLISAGDFVMIMGLTYYFIEASWGLLNDFDNFIQDYGTLKESFKIFKDDNQIFDDESAQELKIKYPEIIFKNLTYAHGKNSIFKNLNIKIKAGERVALIGHSGAGKSTLINLLLKVFVPISGEIIIDGKNISEVTVDSLRENIALIPQDAMLFHRTIYDNIAYSKIGAKKREVVAAAKKAHIHDFIMTLENGYDTFVGERGVKLSGGQRQRIAIARAILKNAPILILDEATSSLDSETETQIQTSINEMLESSNSTVIAIAHRLSTIKHMDRIIVIENGKILEDGKFSELLKKPNGKFKEMWDHQANNMLV